MNTLKSTKGFQVRKVTNKIWQSVSLVIKALIVWFGAPVSSERFYDAENILLVHVHDRYVVTGLIACVISLALIPLANIPLLIMHNDSPILLCYYLNERNTTGLWDHSIFFWTLVGLDSVWLFIVLTFFIFLILLMMNICGGLFLMLKALRYSFFSRYC